MGWFRRKLLTGILILLPTVVTGWVLYHVFIYFDDLLEPVVARYPIIDIPGLGFLAVVLLVLVAGVFAGNLIGRTIIGWLETLVVRIPLIRSMYTAVKQIGEVFLRGQHTAYRKAVLIQYPREGIYVVGFTTKTWLRRGADGRERMFVNIFLPTTPNPTSGLFLMVPEDETEPLDCSIEDALKMVISGGAIVPAPADPSRADLP
ncbi:MAG: DUF502 domain-containing protein [Candidatus Krumholzibacteriota bacterium]|nr:DUF502 domain-containing protein [Candidatus Krumholzibacteriota bacterium]